MCIDSIGEYANLNLNDNWLTSNDAKFEMWTSISSSDTDNHVCSYTDNHVIVCKLFKILWSSTFICKLGSEVLYISKLEPCMIFVVGSQFNLGRGSHYRVKMLFFYLGWDWQGRYVYYEKHSGLFWKQLSLLNHLDFLLLPKLILMLIVYKYYIFR